MGAIRTPSKFPPKGKNLDLWSLEHSPHCRSVRETLCTLELPYYLHNIPFGSPKREEFAKRTKLSFVPYLEDPNTGWKGFGSSNINAYLREKYQTGEIATGETIFDYGANDSASKREEKKTFSKPSQKQTTPELNDKEPDGSTM